jgi:KTSC domain
MRRQPVDSEAVNSIGYDARQQTLAVEFREGRIYDYLGVPEETYRELMRADSIGKFVSTRIKPHFKFRRR